MQQRMQGWLVSAVVVCISLDLSGCSQIGTGGQQRARRAINPVEVSPPLTSHSARPELLAGINSIEIAKPSITSSTGSVAIEPADAQRMIEQTARETMTLKISTPGSSEGAATMRRAAGKSSTDAVLYTDLLRFEERQGSAVGGDPAVVSFKMSMRTVPTGLEVWSAQYFFRQEALSENLLRINERLGKGGLGAGWRSAHDVFQKGVSAALQDFNNQREQRYLVSSR